jgi:hypothetical protein
MTCTEDRDGAIIDMDTTMRDLGDVHRYRTELDHVSVSLR